MGTHDEAIVAENRVPIPRDSTPDSKPLRFLATADLQTVGPHPLRFPRPGGTVYWLLAKN